MPHPQRIAVPQRISTWNLCILPGLFIGNTFLCMEGMALDSRITIGILACFCVLSASFGAIQTWRLHTIQSVTTAVKPSAVPAVDNALSEYAGETAIKANTESLEAEPASGLDAIENEHDVDAPIEKEITLSRARLEKALAKSENKLERQHKNAGQRDPLSKRDSYASPAVAAKAARMVKDAQKAISQGRFDEAIEMLRNSLATDPTHRQAYKALANLYHTLGMTAEENQLYADWSANRPKDAMPHYQQASLYERMGMDSEAYRELQRFQALAKDDARSYSMAASMYRRLGMPQEEGAALQAWVNQAPGSIEALRSMAQYHVRTGARGDALALYSTIAQMAPASADAHRDLAQMYQRLRQNAQAQAEYVTAMNLEPQNLEIRLQLAEFYRQSGDRASAMQTYAALIADAPGSPEAAQARRQLASLQRPAPPPPPKPKPR